MTKKIDGSLILFLLSTLIVLSCRKEQYCNDCSDAIKPVAVTGTDTSLLLPQDTLILDGSASYSPGGTIKEYLWSKVSGPLSFNILNPNAARTQVTSLVEGVYQFELKVTSATGLTARDTMQVNVNANPVVVACDDRPVISASLIPIGALSQGRIGLVCAAAGNKILFAGGMIMGAYTSRVDIYDINTNTWSTAELSKAERQGMVAGVVGSKILFAGGGDNDWGETTSVVDIFDASNNTWSTAQLSKGREYLAAATLNNKVFFAGGTSWETSGTGYSTWETSNVVDIYDNTTNTWTTATLSENRSQLSAATVGNKIYFSGGYRGPFVSNVSKTIDVYDGATNSWSTSQMQETKAEHASVALGNNIFWAAGIFNYANSIFYPSNVVEIRNVTTGASTLSCIIPKIMFSAVVKDDNVVFFTGNIGNGEYSGTHFDIYNMTTNQWSTGLVNKEIYDATIISVNNTIYVAGGRDQASGPYFKEVWKLEF